MFYCLYFFIHALIEAPRLKGSQSCCSCATRTVRYDARITHTRAYPLLSSPLLLLSLLLLSFTCLRSPRPSYVRAAPAFPHTPAPLLSSSKVDVGSSGLRRDRNSRFSAECRGCTRSCVRACVCASVTERIPAEPRASEARLVKDDWGLREDEMQRFLTRMVRRAA